MGLFKCLDKRYWRKFLYIIGFFMLICIVLVTSSCSSSKYSDDKNVEKFCENVVDNSYEYSGRFYTPIPEIGNHRSDMKETAIPF